jgi:hypothetical protein
MNRFSVSARESIPLGPVNIALVEDAARALENAREKIIAPGHWPSWSDPDMPDGPALCVGCWRPITALQLGNEPCPGRPRSWRSTGPGFDAHPDAPSTRGMPENRGGTLMSKAVVRSRAIVLKKRICRGCGTTLRPPRWLCSRVSSRMRPSVRAGWRTRMRKSRPFVETLARRAYRSLPVSTRCRPRVCRTTCVSAGFARYDRRRVRLS